MAQKNKYSDAANSQFYKAKSTKRTHPVYSLRISEEAKNSNDKQWFKDYVDYIVPPYSATVDNYEKMKVWYEVLNNNLDGFKKELESFVNPLGENIGQIEEAVLPYPKLHNNVNVLVGDLLKRNDNHKIVLLTAQAIKAKNTALIEALKASVEERVQIELEKVQLELEGKSPKEIEQFVEALRTQETPDDILSKNWLSEHEIFYSKGLKYCNFDQDVKYKKTETLTDAITSDRCFVYSGWRFGKPCLEIRNTLYTGFHKAPNEPYVHKGDYLWYKKPITVADAFNNYGELLSAEEMEELGVHTYTQNQVIDKRHSLDPRENDLVFDHTTELLYRDRQGMSDFYSKKVGTHQGQGLNNQYAQETLIWETHIEFKAFKRLAFLSYVDEYNEQITLMINDTFEVPKDAEKVKFTNRYGDESTKLVWFDPIMETEYSLEYLWIPRKYEVIRLGADIYPITREVPFQTTSIETPYSSFTLSTFGGIFSSRNAESISSIGRALPAYFQYIYIKHIQNRELAKYQGAIQSVDVDQIPDELGQDLYGEQIRDSVAAYLYYLKRTNKDFYSGSQTTRGGTPPATRSPGASGFLLGTAVELLNLQNLLQLIEVEIGMAMGIPPQRLAQFTADSNVTDNRQALTQSYSMTEPLYFFHNEVWRAALNDYLKNFRTYCEHIFKNNPSLKEHSFHYIMPDGTEELLRVTPDMLEHTDIGLFVSNSGQDQAYMESMLQLSHAFAQNSTEHGLTTVSALIKSITSGASPEEVHKMIELESKKQSERVAQQQEQSNKAQERLVQMEIDNREDQQAAKLEEIDRKGMWDIKAAEIKSVGFGENQDINNNQIPDALEIERLRASVEDNKVKASQVDRKLDLEEKKLAQQKELENKKIKASKNKP